MLTMTTGVDWVEDHRDPASLASRISGAIAGSNLSTAPRIAEASSSEPNIPQPTPASIAAPSAVVSTNAGRSTASPSMSARSWASQPFEDIPPSILSTSHGAPSAAKQAIRSWVWCAIASRAARATWARPVAKLRPEMAPLASGRQCGAPRPLCAGTICTPPLSGTDRASASVSAELPSSPRSSRSHLTRLPATNIEPSSA